MQILQPTRECAQDLEYVRRVPSFGSGTLDPDSIESLAVILEEGSFERAAKALSVTQSAVSQRLHSLEEEVGTLLIVRSRPLRPTAAGVVLLKHARQARLLRADVERDLRGLAPRLASSVREAQRVSIAVNADSIATWVMPALRPLVHQGLQLEIIADDQGFTHELLRQGQVVGCITTVKQPLRGCNVVPIGTMRYVAVAEPTYKKQNCPTGLTAQSFTKVAFVACNRKDDIQTEFVKQALGLKHVNLRQLFVPGSEAQVRAVLAGWGASVMPELLAQRLLEQGALIDLLPAFRLSVQLYWHCWQLESEVLNQLTSALRHANVRRDCRGPLLF